MLSKQVPLIIGDINVEYLNVTKEASFNKLPTVKKIPLVTQSSIKNKVYYPTLGTKNDLNDDCPLVFDNEQIAGMNEGSPTDPYMSYIYYNDFMCTLFFQLTPDKNVDKNDAPTVIGYISDRLKSKNKIYFSMMFRPPRKADNTTSPPEIVKPLGYIDGNEIMVSSRNFVPWSEGGTNDNVQPLAPITWLIDN
jgi:hypothetical protein